MSNGSEDKTNISRHILPTSSNLLGLCFVIFGMAKIYTFAERTLLDEMTAVTILFFLLHACSRTHPYAQKVCLTDMRRSPIFFS